MTSIPSASLFVRGSVCVLYNVTMGNFYDKVAKEYGGYGFASNLPKFTSVYTNGNPEKIFKDRLLDLASKITTALDIGCGDGKFAFEIADNFSSITGLDSSSELLNIAEHWRSPVMTFSTLIDGVPQKWGKLRTHLHPKA